MLQSRDPWVKVVAELRAPMATTQLVQFHFTEPVDNVVTQETSYRFDLCLTPRPQNTRACFPHRWGIHRFEPIGRVFLLPPAEAMIARSDESGEQTSLICALDPQSTHSWLGEEVHWTEQRLQAGLDIRNSNIVALMERLAREIQQPGFASEMLVELICGQLAIELARHWHSLEQAPDGGGLAPWRLRLIEERLRDLVATPTLAELAGLCGLSVRQLTRAFKASRGCSVGDYLAQLRIDRARQLLDTDASVKYIAYSLGFSSPSSFCYAFRRATGESPGHYRNRQRGATCSARPA